MLEFVNYPSQYVVYDLDAFVPDIGGYLGLLLGHSIISIYDLGIAWIKSMKK